MDMIFNYFLIKNFNIIDKFFYFFFEILFETVLKRKICSMKNCLQIRFSVAFWTEISAETESLK
jgi:hypothetical protein